MLWHILGGEAKDSTIALGGRLASGTRDQHHRFVPRIQLPRIKAAQSRLEPVGARLREKLAA
jgi:hypothetical protein